MNNQKLANRTAEFVTAAEILAEAEADQPEIGHSPRGFLSRSSGFLPHNLPLLALPAAYKAWDDVAEAMPELIASHLIHEALTDLPQLSAGPDDLDDVCLWRASLLLGFLIHAWVHTPGAPSDPPASIFTPWTEVNRRLGRPHPGLAFAEYCNYNWTLRDKSGPRHVENMDLMIYWLENKPEKHWVSSLVEIHARSNSLVDAAANLQEALLRQDTTDVKLELVRIQDYLRDMTYKALLKIDPNPYSSTYVDPLIWSKTWVLFTGPTSKHERGLGGAGAPVIHLMDAILERGQYATEFAHETQILAEWLPEYHRRFVDSFRQTSLSSYVESVADLELTGLYNSVFEAFAGKRGFLGMHRLKVYGFMEVGFKAGRTQTNSGFSEETEKRGWEVLDDTMEETRRDRYAGRSVRTSKVRRKLVTPAAANEKSPVHQVVLDTTGIGLHYTAGDRLGIFPQNDAELIQKVVDVLGAEGNEPIQLTSVWREVLAGVIPDVPEVLPLRTFLAYAKIRPLLRPVGKALLDLSRCKELHELLENRREDQVELWDAFDMLAAENYDLKRFWKAAPWEAESIARIVPPEHFRIYSIASAPALSPDVGNGTSQLQVNGKQASEELHLTVGRLKYRSQPTASGSGQTRKGAASGYLVNESEQESEIPVQIFRPSRFHLPDDAERPIVMFAGGTGISPFRGFLEQRSADPNSGPNWLFQGVRTFSDLPYADSLKEWINAGKLNLRVAFSREEHSLRIDNGEFVLKPGPRAYVDQLLDEQEVGATIWRYLQSKEDGGLGGYFYVCGQARFAHTVIEGLKKVIASHLAENSDNSPSEEAVNRFFRRLTAQGRIMLDIFTTFAPSAAASVHGFEQIYASEVIKHNNDDQGYWTVIQGNVYDMTEFMWLHPGGERLLLLTAGLDSTRSYEKAEHHLNSEVHAQLDLYKIGTVRRLNFKNTWGIAIKPRSIATASDNGKRSAGALMYLSLQDFYRHWMRYAYEVVEIENSLNNNLTMRYCPMIRGDEPETMSKIKARLLLDTHGIFYNNNWPDLLGEKLEMLWNITIGFCSHDTSIVQLPEAIADLRSSDRAGRAEFLTNELRDRLSALSPTPEDDPSGWTQFDQQLRAVEKHDRTFIAAIKDALRRGLLEFEAHGDRVVESGGAQLVQSLEQIPSIIESYYDGLAESLAEHVTAK